MKFDNRLVTGIFIGVVFGLHYTTTLMAYVPVLSVITLILVLRMFKTIHH